jgi:hypothetical protein
MKKAFIFILIAQQSLRWPKFWRCLLEDRKGVRRALRHVRVRASVGRGTFLLVLTHCLPA